MMSAKVELWPDCRRNQPLGAQRAGIVHVSAGRPIVGQQDVSRSSRARSRERNAYHLGVLVSQSTKIGRH